jgi:hypothetical protein
MITETPRKSPLQRFAVLGLSGIAGALFGYGAIQLMQSMHLKLSGWSDGLALGIIAFMVLLGLIYGLGGYSIPIANRLLKQEDGRPAPLSQIKQLRRQGGVFLLAGALLALPLAFGQSPQTSNFVWHVIGMIAIGVGFTAQTLINIRLWQRADEFLRRMMLETSAICFWVLQAALFLWAAAERLGFAPRLSSWDSLTILMAVYLSASLFIASRRGAA